MNAPNVQNPTLEQEAAAVLADVKAITVTDTATYALAAERLVGLRQLGKRVEEWFRPLVESAHRAHKELTSRRADTLKPIEAELSRLTRDMAAWKSEEDRRAREEAARQARAQQELERQLALEEAAALEAQGLPDQAEAVVEQAIAAPAPVVPVVSTVPKTQGLSYRSLWRHEVVDAALVPREYLVVNEPAIAAVVKATKGSIAIPGIRVWEEQIPVVRA